MDWHKYTKN